MRTLLIAFPEPSSRWGGERLRKLCEPLLVLGWRPVFLATTERSARRMHGEYSQFDWLDGYEVVRAPDASPYVAGSAVRRVLRRRSAVDTGPGVVATAGGATSRPLTLRILNRVWLPDAYAGWVPFAFAAGLRAIRRTRPAAIFSSYPPASSHLVALLLHRATGLPWIADFRDPWSRADEQTYPTGSPHVAAALERAALRHATLVTAVGPTLAEILSARTSTPVHVLPQGFDAAAVPDGATKEKGDALRVVHMGTLARWPSDPGPLLRAAERAVAAGAAIRIEQFGQTFAVDDEIAYAVAAGFLSVHEPVSRDEALQQIAAADVAVVIRTEPGRLWITTKLWDYLAARTPVLSIADPESDVSRLVTTTGAGVAVPYWDEDAIVAALIALHNRWRGGDLRWEPVDEELERYDSRRVASELVQLLDGMA